MKNMKTPPMVARRRTIMILIYALCFFMGARAVFGEDSLVELLTALCMGLLATQFCITDSHIRQRPLASGLHWIIFFTWPISAPVYLFRTRGIKHLHWAVLGIAGGIAALMLGCFAIILLFTISGHSEHLDHIMRPIP
jgi:hypothetical protein